MRADLLSMETKSGELPPFQFELGFKIIAIIYGMTVDPLEDSRLMSFPQNISVLRTSIIMDLFSGDQSNLGAKRTMAEDWDGNLVQAVTGVRASVRLAFLSPSVRCPASWHDSPVTPVSQNQTCGKRPRHIGSKGCVYLYCGRTCVPGGHKVPSCSDFSKSTFGRYRRYAHTG